MLHRIIRNFKPTKFVTQNYYFLTNKDYPEIASAFAPSNSKLSFELIPELAGVSKLPFDLELVKLSAGNKGLIESPDLSNLEVVWYDFQPNNLGWPLISEKFKNLVCSNLTGKEFVNWVSATIRNGKEKRVYYIPRFEKKLDVLHLGKTTYVEGTDHIIKPHFSLKKINELAIFHKPDSSGFWKIPSAIYISETLKNDILKENLIGIGFEKVSVS